MGCRKRNEKAEDVVLVPPQAFLHCLNSYKKTFPFSRSYQSQDCFLRDADARPSAMPHNGARLPGVFKLPLLTFAGMRGIILKAFVFKPF